MNEQQNNGWIEFAKNPPAEIATYEVARWDSYHKMWRLSHAWWNGINWFSDLGWDYKTEDLDGKYLNWELAYQSIANRTCEFFSNLTSAEDNEVHFYRKVTLPNEIPTTKKTALT